MANQNLSIPSGMGGLVRFNEEYKSRFMLNPSHVIVLTILIIAFVAVLKIFFPI